MALPESKASLRAESVLQAILAGTGGAVGAEFFPRLVKHLAASLGVRYAYVTEHLSARNRLKVIASWENGKHGEVFEYETEGTPCGEVLENGVRAYRSGVADLFPADKFLRDIGAQCYVGAPVPDKAGRAIGHLCVLDEKHLSEEELFKSTLQIFAARAGAELERELAEAALKHNAMNLARMEHELRTAAAMQTFLFPRYKPIVDTLDIAYFTRSASENGGDWCGFANDIPGHFHIFIGDVTGHGLPAAFVAASAFATCRTMAELFAREERLCTPRDFMTALNGVVYETGNNSHFMTFFAADFNLKTGELRYTNAGHPPPLVVSRNGTVRKLKHMRPDLMLGVRPIFPYSEDAIQLKKGDTIVFFTDGLVDNQNPRRESWKLYRLYRLLRTRPRDDAQQIADAIVESAMRFYAGQPFEDDMTLVVCRVRK